MSRAAEWLLRLLALGLIAWQLHALLREPPAAPRAVAATADGLPAALERWSARDFPDSVRLDLARAPDPVERAWLAALRRSGTAVAWIDDGVPTAALEAFPAGGPGGESWVLLARPDDADVALADGTSLLDTLRTRGGGAALRVAGLRGRAQASEDAPLASAGLRDSLVLRPVLLLGRAGWEARFLATALEERGWTVAARLAVAPGADVLQGSPGAIDTARYAAVVAVDSAAARDAAALARYVRAGGGLVLLPGAAAAPALRALAPAAVGAALRPRSAEFGHAPLDALEARALAPLAPAAVALDTRGEQTTVAAWRVGRGRVVQVGYLDSWRWRMEGPDGAPAAHRAWWSALVAGAAYRPVVPLPEAPAAREPADPAPRAALLDALGPPAPAGTGGRGGAAAGTGADGPPQWLAWPLVLLALLGEWTLRRARGVR